MSYIKLDIENLEEARERVLKIFLEQDKRISKIKEKVEVHQAKAHRSRKLLAVDSGFNSAFETSFVVFKAAVVDEKLEVNQSSRIFLFHVGNYQTDRMRRLLMQQTLYEALLKTLETGAADNSIVLVDGTITLTVFYPTEKDGREYNEHFKNFYEKLYSPLVDQCLKRDTILLGFIKRTGSTYLAEHLGISGLYDIYIIDALLRGNGQYVASAIPLVDTQAKRLGVHYKYITFYLNLKGWNYRFELLKQQEYLFLEAIENLLYWATEAYYGMNPIFSKADEYARVSKREANLKFNYVVQCLPEKDRNELLVKARKRTHFGYRSKRLPERLIEG